MNHELTSEEVHIIEKFREEKRIVKQLQQEKNDKKLKLQKESEIDAKPLNQLTHDELIDRLYRSEQKSVTKHDFETRIKAEQFIAKFERYCETHEYKWGYDYRHNKHAVYSAYHIAGRKIPSLYYFDD